MQAIKAGTRRTEVVGLMNNFGGMILKRLELRKDVGWKSTKKGVAIAPLEMTKETVRVTAVGRSKNLRTSLMVCMWKSDVWMVRETK